MSVNNKPVVLVTDGGNVNSLAIVRYLGITDLYRVIVTGTNGMAVARFSRYCERFYKIASTGNTEAYASDLLDIVRKHSVDVIVPVGFKSFRSLIQAKDKFAGLVHISLPAKNSFDVASSKPDTLRLAESLGVLVPKTTRILSVDELDTIALSFPVVIKSPKELGGRMVEYATTREEMKEKYRRLVATHGLTPDDYPMLQEYIKGKGAGYFAFMEAGEVKAWFMHRRVREFPVSGGRSVCAQAFFNPKLKEAGEKILRGLDWNGCAMVEFKETASGQFYLMEVNPKLWGSLELALASGVRFHEWMLPESLRPPQPPAGIYRQNEIFQWILNGELYHAVNRPGSILSIIRSMFSSKKDLWFRDPAPNLLQILLIFVDLYKVITKR